MTYTVLHRDFMFSEKVEVSIIVTDVGLNVSMLNYADALQLFKSGGGDGGGRRTKKKKQAF